MAHFYEVLIAELREDPLGLGYASLSNAEAAAVLNAKTRTRTRTRFCSWRAIAEVLTDEEYATVKAVLQQLATQSPKVADMLKFLDMPCDDTGTTGGIDFGSEYVRGFIRQLKEQQLISEDVACKLLSLGQVPCSRAEVLGLGEVNAAHIASARKMMG